MLLFNSKNQSLTRPILGLKEEQEAEDHFFMAESSCGYEPIMLVGKENNPQKTLSKKIFKIYFYLKQYLAKK